MSNDNELRDRFAAMRCQDEANAGEFSALLQRAKPRPNRKRVFTWVAITTSLAVMVAIVVISVGRPRRGSGVSPEMSITEWRSSTDFLLHTPGEEMLQSVPQIGEWQDLTKTRARGRRPPLIKRKSLTKPLLKESLS